MLPLPLVGVGLDIIRKGAENLGLAQRGSLPHLFQGLLRVHLLFPLSAGLARRHLHWFLCRRSSRKRRRHQPARIKSRPGGDEFLPVPALEQGNEGARREFLVVPDYEAQDGAQFIARQVPWP